MKNIVIVGAGGFGREVFNYVEDCICSGMDWRIKGFLDDNPNSLDNYNYPQKIIGSISDYVPQSGDHFVCAMGNPVPKKSVVENLISRGAKFERLIHTSARVGRNVNIGEGVVICPNVVLTCDISIGDFAMINCTSGCGHDSSVGAYATISSYCDITGHCEVGEGAFLASHVAMRPNAKVGNWARVGISSSVIMNIKDGVSAFGNPAIPIK